MIVIEDIGGGIVRTYSDAGFYIHGGDPEADYVSAEDPADAGRTYTETDIPIEEPVDPEEEATTEDYEEALAQLGIE